jgi:hypothetical protein
VRELEALLGQASGFKDEGEVEEARRRAEQLFQRNRARLAELDSLPPHSAGGAGVTGQEDALEVARRKKHLAELRDQLRASKAQERQEAAQALASTKQSHPPLSPSVPSDELTRRQALAAQIRAEMNL